MESDGDDGEIEGEPPRPWHRFSLRTLLIAMAVVSVSFAIAAMPQGGRQYGEREAMSGLTVMTAVLSVWWVARNRRKSNSCGDPTETPPS